MTDALLLIAVVCAIAGAWRGSRAAVALLASTALTSAFAWLGVPFNIAVWLLLDVVVIVAVLAGKRVWADWLIVLLFPLAWAAYGTPIGHEATTLIVSAQLLLTFPKAVARAAFARWKATFRHRKEWTDLNLREANA